MNPVPSRPNAISASHRSSSDRSIAWRLTQRRVVAFGLPFGWLRDEEKPFSAMLADDCGGRRRRSRERKHERDDIIARAVKPQILPSVKCSVITSGLPRPVAALYSPAPKFHPPAPLGGGPRRLRRFARHRALASATEIRPIAVARLSILLARMTRLRSSWP